MTTDNIRRLITEMETTMINTETWTTVSHDSQNRTVLRTMKTPIRAQPAQATYRIISGATQKRLRRPMMKTVTART